MEPIKVVTSGNHRETLTLFSLGALSAWQIASPLHNPLVGKIPLLLPLSP